MAYMARAKLAGLRAGFQGLVRSSGWVAFGRASGAGRSKRAPDSTGVRPAGPESRRDFASSDYLQRMMADAMKCGAVRGGPVGGRSESE